MYLCGVEIFQLFETTFHKNKKKNDNAIYLLHVAQYLNIVSVYI